MTPMSRVYSRVERRETSSPRSALDIALAVMIIALCIYAAMETVLSAFFDFLTT